MSKLKKHPILDIKKFQAFEKIIPRRKLYNVLGTELEDVIIALRRPRNKVSKQLKKYVIIRLVTIVESYLQNTVAKLIDENDLDITRLYEGTEIPIPLKQFHEIQKNDLTKGKIVAINFNFQNMEETNKVFSRLFDIDFFDGLKKWIKHGIKYNAIPESESHLIESWDIFQEMFTLRHEIVHTLQTPYKIRKNKDYFEDLWDATWHFLNCVYNFSEDITAYKRGEIKHKTAIGFFDKLYNK